jgi:hypothetical protein
MTRYFDLVDDKYIPGRWSLGSPIDEEGREVSPWQFIKGNQLDIARRLRLPILQQGRPLEFDQASFAIPVAHARVVDIFERLGVKDVQFIPVEIESQPDSYFILNATRVVKCIDDARSGQVNYWKPEDGQPAKVGTYRAVHRLRIDPTKVGDARIFRTWGWVVTLVVSGDIKEALEREHVSGTRFVEV